MDKLRVYVPFIMNWNLGPDIPSLTWFTQLTENRVKKILQILLRNNCGDVIKHQSTA